MPTADPAGRSPGWTVIVPVKDLSRAKSRLDSPPGERERLALAFAADVVTAALASPVVGEVLVVTADAEAAAVLADQGARIVPDPGTGLNGALTTAEQSAGPRCAVIAGDLPALRTAELTDALEAAQAHERSFVADAAGTGTTLLARTGGIPLDPHFGVRSRAAHRVSGAIEITLPATHAGLRRDVDTDVDLWDARRLGVGSQTTRLLS